MAAAVTLASRGVPVTVFESGAVPGGRARRVRTEGHELDNGQHILVGAYTELFRMMGLVGVRDEALLRVPLEIRYARDFRLRSRRLPAPLGLALGLLLAKGIPFSERLGAARFMAAMRQGGFRLARDISVIELLDQFRQNGVIGHFLWRPLCVSALNTPPDLASANRFLAALRDTLGGGDGASDLLLPRVDLSRMFPEPAMEFVQRNGGEVRLRTTIENIQELKQEYSSVIVAVGPHQLKNLLPDAAADYSYQPIYTCYLQYAPAVQLPFPMLGLAGGLVQWVFDRGALLGEKGRLACVISAQGDHQQMEQDEIARRCHLELKKETLVKEEPVWTRIIAEKRATITCAVNLQSVKTDFGQVHLAGDYTDPEYPPTLEAAVRSGVRAALEVAK
jgi:squalene-associated FAD-dependent desaturase